jgi:hypothetical protein
MVQAGVSGPLRRLHLHHADPGDYRRQRVGRLRSDAVTTMLGNDNTVESIVFGEDRRL